MGPTCHQFYEYCIKIKEEAENGMRKYKKHMTDILYSMYRTLTCIVPDPVRK